MSKLTLEQMKESNASVRARLNEVEGYYPEAELEEFPIRDENGVETGATRKLLRLNKKREWFKLKYPEGVVRTKIIFSSGYTAKVQAFLYASYKDDANMYLAESKATCSVNPRDPYLIGKTEEELLGCAENKAAAKAESNVLYKAGFGFQLESQDEDSTMADEQLFADLLSSSTLPAPPAPTNKREEAKKERKAEEKKDVKACGSDIDFKPKDSPAEDTLPSGSILQEVMAEEHNEAPAENVEAPHVEVEVPRNEVQMTMEDMQVEGLKPAPPLKNELSYEDALSFPYKHQNLNTLGEIAEKNPQMIVWMIEKMEDDVANLCKIIARNDIKVGSIASRKGVDFK